ncbi:TolC family protein [Natronoflexus pectinivorans]|uniref:Outer membrane protein TolC n=1 Tax=Natronoflexus pectinivorans TaxID=682526 RepID=A0A4R2GFR0_9BACT|nr:TolC family protein [Natronoflexus pectinivorans]TCO07063.1 outer membrane protein TolC [Natronoflexus pectinivorans]
MRIRAIFFILILPFFLANSQEKREMNFDEFMQYVLTNNLELIIEQYEVTAATAAVTAARIFEDPELEMIFPMFRSDEFDEMPRSIAFEMEIPIELFGKRRNRIRLARMEQYAAEAELEDFLRYLRAEAAEAFIELLTEQKKLQRMELTLQQLNQLLEVNKALYEAGDIGEVDVIKTRLEARNFHAELFDARMELSEILSGIHFMMGGIPADSLVLTGEMVSRQIAVDYPWLREQAISRRSDVIAAQRYVQASEIGMRLARSERLPNISIIAGYHNETGRSPMPGMSATYGGLIIPLQFSGLNRGEYQMATVAYEQSQTMLSATILEVEAGIKRAWDNHRLLSQKRLLFDESILSDAEKVRDAVVFSYQRGEVSLLEVLEAQSALNETYINYYDTQAQYTNSIIELSRESGEWLLAF